MEANIRDEMCFQQRSWAQRVGTDEVATTALFPVDGNAAVYQQRVDEIRPEAGAISVRRNGRGLIGFLPLEGPLDEIAAVLVRLATGDEEVAAADVAQIVHAVAPDRPVRSFHGANWERRRRVIAATIARLPDGRWVVPITAAGIEQQLPQTFRLAPEGAMFAGQPANVVSAALRDAGQVALPEYVRQVAALVDPRWSDPYARVRTRDTHELIELVGHRGRGLVFVEEMDEKVLGPEVVPWRTAPEDIGQSLRTFADKHRVRCDLITPTSTVGGLPLVRVRADKGENAVRAFGAVHGWARGRVESVVQEVGQLLDPVPA